MGIARQGSSQSPHLCIPRENKACADEFIVVAGRPIRETMTLQITGQRSPWSWAPSLPGVPQRCKHLLGGGLVVQPSAAGQLPLTGQSWRMSGPLPATH